MDRELFLDTSYAIALASHTDRFHARAVELASHIGTTSTRLITTRAVLLEIGNALAKRRFRAGAVVLLDALEADPRVGIVALTESLYREAMQLFRRQQDKDWGLVDCVSLVVMRERQIHAALSADAHFAQAGFRVLLTE